jgi:hypothetical protein
VNLHYTYKIEVEKAYIIYLPDNEKSTNHAQNCARSCEDVGMNYELWSGFDGTGDEIKPPPQIADKDWLKWIKCSNPTLDKSEIACFLSHLSLWAKCAELDKPIVILEHDAILLQRITEHPGLNLIVYLGNHEQIENDFSWSPIPTMIQWQGLRCLCRAHAYSIDPFIARRLLSSVLETGINKSVDVYIRSDIFTQIQNGIYAYDKKHNESVIKRNKSPEDIRICNKIL